MSGGTDAYHCVATPDKLDLWRDALFLGTLFTSEIVRVIGVDGKVGPLVEQTMPALCATGWVPQRSCDVLDGKYYSVKNYGLAYEETDGGAGWYYFHHHHQHVSANGNIPKNPNAIAPDFGLAEGSALVLGGAPPSTSWLSFAGVAGQAFSIEPPALPADDPRAVKAIRLRSRLAGLH